MMNPNEWEVIKARQQEMIRDAEVHNAAQEARRGKPSLYASVMAQVGEKLVAIGETLQERYGDLVDEVEARQVEA
jgi:hypothetical protein